MLNKFVSATALALAASQLVYAQTHTDCDPREKTCPNDPAVGKENTVVVNFLDGENDFFTTAAGTTIKYADKGAEFTINKGTDAPTIESTKYIFFGRVDVKVIAAPGAGIVTSVVLESDDLDEIDWEWVGSDEKQVQTNYFGKGDDSTFDRGGYSPVDKPQSSIHTYSLDWTPEKLDWIIDDVVVRTLTYSDAKGGSRYPQTPCKLKLGIWDAGAPGQPKGTATWAGGYTDFDLAPFTAYYESVTIQDYAGPDGVSNAKSYKWASGSDGSYDSISVLTSGGDDDEPTSTKATTVIKTTTTKAASSTSETKTTKGSDTTLSTVTSAPATTTTGTSGSDDATTTDGGSSDQPTGSTPVPSGSASPTPTPTGAAFKTGFSGALVGAGLIAALAL